MHTFQAAGWKVSSVALPASASCVAACTALSTIGDITDKRVREIAVEKTLSAYGRIDVLINNAGVGLYASATGVTRELFLRLIDVNVYAPLALAQLVLPLMRAQQSGSIVTIGSVAGSVALPWTAGYYSASKAALHAIHDSLRREVRNNPVHLMKVAPGIVDTDFRAHVLAGEAPPVVQKDTPRSFRRGGCSSHSPRQSATAAKLSTSPESARSFTHGKCCARPDGPLSRAFNQSAFRFPPSCCAA